jgi:hypothetical protein
MSNDIDLQEQYNRLENKQGWQTEYEKSSDTADQFVDDAKVLPLNSALVLTKMLLDKQVKDIKDKILLEMTFIAKFDAEDMALIEKIFNKNK